MCDPGTAFLVGSTALSAVGSLQQGMATATALEHNAAVADQEAANERMKSDFEARQQRRRVRRLMGSQRAAYGRSGVTASGTPLDVLADTAGEAELERLVILRNGEVAAIGFENKAAGLRSQAGAARTAGIIGAAATIAGGAYAGYSNGLFGASSSAVVSPEAALRVNRPVIPGQGPTGL
jgi:hypothetical protein